jgi:dolichyl-phosphate-mannose-protein mannosyltransferase
MTSAVGGIGGVGANPAPHVSGARPGLGWLRAISPLVIVCASLFLLGGYLRFHRLATPASFLFDENHFVENARNYLVHHADENDHPPLGKLIIAGCIHLLGDQPIGWRFGASLAGVLSVVLAAVTSSRLFRSRDAGWISAGLFAADGFLVSYSRAALLDGFLVLLLLIALAICTRKPTVLTALSGGVTTGAAICVKFSGLGTFVPLGIALALSSRSTRSKFALGGVLSLTAMVTYVALYAWGLRVAMQPATAFDVARETARLYVHHAALTDMKNPWTSGWITWGLPARPILLGLVGEGVTVEALTSLGNPLLWWSSVALAASVVALLAWRGIRSGITPTRPGAAAAHLPAFVAQRGPAVLVLLGAAGGYLAPWVLTHRDSYVYHFLPTYAVLLLLLSGYLSFARNAWPVLVLGFLAAVLVVASFYAPVWSMMPESFEALRLRLFLPGWR